MVENIIENEIIEEEIIEEPVKKRPPIDRALLAKQSKISRIKIKIEQLNEKLKGYDYIGTKISTGRATREEYATEITQMTEWANEINALEEQLKTLKK